jgi:hypothetical protein
MLEHEQSKFLRSFEMIGYVRWVAVDLNVIEAFFIRGQVRHKVFRLRRRQNFQ